MDVIIALLMRRWGVLVMGGVFVLVGFVILCAHLTFAVGWPSLSGMAFYPGLPSSSPLSGSGAEMSPGRSASLSGQISIALGVALLFGWIGFSLGKRSGPA